MYNIYLIILIVYAIFLVIFSLITGIVYQDAGLESSGKLFQIIIKNSKYNIIKWIFVFLYFITFPVVGLIFYGVIILIKGLRLNPEYEAIIKFNSKTQIGGTKNGKVGMLSMHEHKGKVGR